jgi:hypothetical protein
MLIIDKVYVTCTNLEKEYLIKRSNTELNVH